MDCLDNFQKLKRAFNWRGIETFLKEAKEVSIRILHIHMKIEVTFEFDRESEKINLKCGPEEGMPCILAFSMCRGKIF